MEHGVGPEAVDGHKCDPEDGEAGETAWDGEGSAGPDGSGEDGFDPEDRNGVDKVDERPPPGAWNLKGQRKEEG
jgi:hypothetical protein